MRIRAALSALALAGFGLVGTLDMSAQQGANIEGRVEIGVPISTKRPTSTYSRSVPGAKLAPMSELRNVVVYLIDAPTRAMTPVRAEIRQLDETFVPRVVAVPVGSTVEFPNDDPIYHNVFSLSRVKAFNLGKYPRGQSRSIRFDKPGIVKMFCEIHSHMSATVMVFDHPWFAVPTSEGRFELPAVPPGDRTITAWHERLGATTLNLRVEPGRASTADFVLPVPARP
ncbi:MAG: carboxypeptidase regulatory-like domain-containing protein [Vicinamibacterales bacterium]